jgi:hypothetical protein
MLTFLFTHHFPEGFQTSPETAAAARAWFASLGDNLLSGRPATLETRRLGNCRADEAQIALTLVSADDMESAVALASTWPLLARGGGVDVREFALLRPPVHAIA